MARISPKTLNLVADGKTIEVKKPSKKNFELNKDLVDPQNFRDFVTDPKTFLAKYDLQVDADIASKLKEKLKGLNNLDDLSKVFPVHGGDPDNPRGATVWAVALGAFSFATSKVAVAF
jgi:hypothetical protein